MSLITETGAVVAGAESYVSVVDASVYHAARGTAPWATLSVTQMEEALRRATDYMVQMYRARWKGYRKDGAQVLDWPRSFVYLEPFVHGVVGTYPYLVADTIVPVEVKNACAELALRAAAGALAADLERGVQSETVGSITTVYDKADPQYTRYRALDALLSPYLTGSSMNVRVART